MPTAFERGLLVGLLVGEGHFGGDGRQPHVTLRMHVRHEGLFRWIDKTFPGGKVYGPYVHGGRHYLQWMARGTYLRDQILPLLEDHLTSELDEPSRQRLEEMKATYARRLSSPGPTVPVGGRGGGPGGPHSDEAVRDPGPAGGFRDAGSPASSSTTKQPRRSKRDMRAAGAEIFARLHHGKR